IDPRDGTIKAMVGGVDFEKNQLNMAVSPRQPGSAIKPLYYAAAIDEGIITPDTTLNNKARDFGGYFPHNDSTAPAKATVRQALTNSYNVASVEILNRLGVDEAFRYLENFGISSLTDNDKNLALGLGGMSRGISPLQMAAAFGVFADQGRYHQPYCIEKIEDPSGEVIYSNESLNRRVINSNTVVLMDSMLKDVVRYGTGSSAAIAIKSGGKTGTTTDSRDLWYVGYTEELATAVWVGNSDGKAVGGYSTYGGKVSGPIWRDYMNSLYYGYVLEEKPLPKSIEEESPSEPTENTEQPGQNSESEQPSAGESNPLEDRGETGSGNSADEVTPPVQTPSGSTSTPDGEQIETPASPDIKI
ncbi:MAG: penicillin-binding transpeptidase domain-containing protein, partial [Syntrophomonas sp.]